MLRFFSVSRALKVFCAGVAEFVHSQEYLKMTDMEIEEVLIDEREEEIE